MPDHSLDCPPPSRGEDMSYDGYLQLDSLLAAQRPVSTAPDELLFIVQHQTAELWMKLLIHELRVAMAAIAGDQPAAAVATLGRVCRVLAQMTDAWDVLRTLTPGQFAAFRDGLGRSSGFQSWQYRAIEFLLGNRRPGLLKLHAARPAVARELEAILDRPGLYDVTLQLLDRRGFDVGAVARRRDWRQSRPADHRVLAAWLEVHAEPERHRPLFELAERLVDLEDHLRRWRFNHVTTVERVIGMKRGTGNSAGVPYLRAMLDVVLFPELWDLRTQL